MATGFRSIDGELGLDGSHEPGDIVQVDYGWRTAWSVVAEYEQAGGSCWIVVEDPIGYRVHDEGELIPYWEQTKSEGVAPSAAYEIADSQYLREMRSGVSSLTQRPMRHIIFAGQNICLEIIATKLPNIVSVRPEPIESVERWEELRNAKIRSAAGGENR